MPIDVRGLKKPGLYEDVLEVLTNTLGDDYALDLSILAAHVCDEKSKIPLNKVLNNLFHHAFTIPQLLSALLQCESLRMLRLFSGLSALPVEKQFDNLEYVLHHFNAIQDAVLYVGKDYLLQAQAQFHADKDSFKIETERLSSERLDDASSHDVISLSLKKWTRDKKIKLYNFFKGVPVHATVEVMKVGTDYIYVKPSTDLIKVLSSHSKHDMAYAICADEKEQVSVSIAEVVKGGVVLKFGEVSASLLYRRKNLGVRITDDIKVGLRVRMKSLQDVFLRDVSSTGLGFLLPEKYHNACKMGEVIECRFQLAGKDIVASGWVRWMMVMNGSMRMGIELRSNIAVQQALQKEVFRIQRQVILALNDLEVPEKLSKVLG